MEGHYFLDIQYFSVLNTLTLLFSSIENKVSGPERFAGMDPDFENKKKTDLTMNENPILENNYKVFFMSVFPSYLLVSPSFLIGYLLRSNRMSNIHV